MNGGRPTVSPETDRADRLRATVAGPRPGGRHQGARRDAPRDRGFRRYWPGGAAGRPGIAGTACPPASAPAPGDTVGKSSSAARLTIPPLTESHVGADGVRTFELEARR